MGHGHSHHHHRNRFHHNIFNNIKHSFDHAAHDIRHAVGHVTHDIGHAVDHVAHDIGHAVEDEAKKEISHAKKRVKKIAKAAATVVKKTTEGVEIGGEAVLKTAAKIPGVKEAANAAADVVNKVGDVERKLDNATGGALTAASGILTPGVRAGIALADVAAKSIKKGKFNVKDMQEVADTAMAPLKKLTKFIDRQAERVGVPENVREVTTQLGAMEAEYIGKLVTPNVGHMVDTLHEGRLDKTLMEGGKVMNYNFATAMGAYIALSGEGSKALHKMNKLKRERGEKIAAYKKRLAAFKKAIAERKAKLAKRKRLLRAMFIAWLKKRNKKNQQQQQQQEQEHKNQPKTQAEQLQQEHCSLAAVS